MRSAVGCLVFAGAALAAPFAAPVAVAHAQADYGTVHLSVQHESRPVPGAIVGSRDVVARTDTAGRAVLQLTAGKHTLSVARLGFVPETVFVDVRAGLDTTILVMLEAVVESVEEVVVTATRMDRRVQDIPLRVEVLPREEIEEKMLMTPGDISMMLNETGGLRVQTTNPSLGGANIRVHGLRGRYTLVLSDGLPLYGGQTGSLGLLQIPPMDLGQVEVIKGVASALYGAAALGGVVNLVTRRPEAVHERELLLNQTTRNGTDGVAWLSGPMAERLGYALLGSAHRQASADIDRDGWTDIPQYERAVVRPRLFWTGDRGRTGLVAAGATLENRRGGTMTGGAAPDGSDYEEALNTRRFDAGGIARLPFASGMFSARSSATVQLHRHRFGTVRERDRHATYFAEAALTVGRDSRSGVVGVAFQREHYRATDVPRFNYTHDVPAAFVQYEDELAPWFVVSASARADAHSEYGTLVNPRLSALVRTPAGWTARFSAGTGAFAPTPFTEATEVTGLKPIRAFGSLRAERASSGSVDVGGTAGPFEINGTLFASRIRHPVIVRAIEGSPSELELLNGDHPVRTAGADALLRHRTERSTTTLSYAYTRASEELPDGTGRRAVPLTPAHTAGLVSVWEQHERWRVGFEAYYTGSQLLDDNPYRTESPGYVLFGLLGERRVGRARVFVNFENIGDVRMTKHHPLVRPTRGPGGRWTTDAWGPLEGRVINGGVRVDFGAGAGEGEPNDDGS